MNQDSDVIQGLIVLFLMEKWIFFSITILQLKM